LKKVTQHPYFDFQDAARQISQLITELDQKFKVASGTPKSNFKDNYQRIHERISELFNGKVGSEPSFDTLARWCKMGKVRYLLKQPP
ncbi:PIN-like domain-containing protein, partial [Escherichia coli]|uniref:PIN-like domain-containing protein n=1 Tax=Escherichia coli TaxID=562 RepID=UPI0039E166C3